MQIADKRNKYQKRQRYIKFNVKMSSNFCVDLYCYDIIYTRGKVRDPTSKFKGARLT